MHPNATAEPVLAAWGIDTDGKPVFVGLDAASSESGDAWEGFLTGLGERGLRLPAAGHQRRRGRVDRRARADHGCRAAATLPRASRQKRAGQGAQERPGAGEGRLLGDLRRAPTTPGATAMAVRADREPRSFAKRRREPTRRRAVPARRPFEALTVHLRFPREHWTQDPALELHRAHLRRDPPTDKVIGRLPGEQLLPDAGVGGARPAGRVARCHHDPRPAPAAGRPAPARCTTRRPNCRNGIRKFTPKRQPIPSPSRRITTVSERNLRPNFYTASGTPPPVRRTPPGQ